MSVYYNSVGEGWFKKNKVVNEEKKMYFDKKSNFYLEPNRLIRAFKNPLDALKHYEKKIGKKLKQDDEISVISGVDEKGDRYFALVKIDDGTNTEVKDVKNVEDWWDDDWDEKCDIIEESKDNVVSEENSEIKSINEVKEMAEIFTDLSNATSLIISGFKYGTNPVFNKLNSILKDLYKKIGNLYKNSTNKDNIRKAIEEGVKSAGRNAVFLSYDSRLNKILNNLLSSEYDGKFNERDIFGY